MTRGLHLSTGLFGFALAVAYWPWITGAATTPRWLVLVGIVAVSIFTASKAVEKIDTASLLGLAFVCWAFLTAAWSAAPEWWDATWKLLLMAGLYTVGTRIADLRPLLVGCAAGVAISSAIVVLERLGPLAGRHYGSPPSGLFVNGLYLAEFAAMVAAGLLALGWWRWALLCCAPALLLVSLPRGPLVALAVACIPWRRMWWLLLFVPAILTLLIRFRPESVEDRLLTWADLVGKLTFWGHGLGSYASGAPVLELLGRKTHANNDLLEIAYELGAVGVILALGFVAALFWPRPHRYGFVEYGMLRSGGYAVVDGTAGNAISGSGGSGGSGVVSDAWPAPAALIVIVFLVEGLFGFPLHMPATAGLFALAAGHLARTA